MKRRIEFSALVAALTGFFSAQSWRSPAALVLAVGAALGYVHPVAQAAKWELVAKSERGPGAEIGPATLQQ